MSFSKQSQAKILIFFIHLRIDGPRGIFLCVTVPKKDGLSFFYQYTAGVVARTVRRV
jgi:hypothetical protein